MKYIISGILLLLLLCAQAFFFPIIIDWYVRTYFPNSKGAPDFFMGMVMMILAIATLGGSIACIAFGVGKLQKD